jgi:hypothetical protein
MADTKISALSAATNPLAGTEVIPVVQNGETKNVSVSSLLSAIEATLRRQLIPAAAITPRASSTGPDVNGTTMSPNSAVIDQLFFSNATQQYAAVAVTAPNGCTKFKARVEWTSPVSGSGDATWEVSALWLGDGVAMGTAFGTAQSAVDTFVATNENHVSPLTAAITPAGTAADGRTCLVQITRTAAGFTQPAGLNFLVLEWEP